MVGWPSSIKPSEIRARYRLAWGYRATLRQSSAVSPYSISMVSFQLDCRRNNKAQQGDGSVGSKWIFCRTFALAQAVICLNRWSQQRQIDSLWRFFFHNLEHQDCHRQMTRSRVWSHVTQRYVSPSASSMVLRFLRPARVIHSAVSRLPQGRQQFTVLSRRKLLAALRAREGIIQTEWPHDYLTIIGMRSASDTAAEKQC